MYAISTRELHSRGVRLWRDRENIDRLPYCDRQFSHSNIYLHYISEKRRLRRRSYLSRLNNRWSWPVDLLLFRSANGLFISRFPYLALHTFNQRDISCQGDSD